MQQLRHGRDAPRAGCLGAHCRVLRQFHVDGFVPAFVGALVVTCVSFLLSLFVGSGAREGRRFRDDDA